MVFEQLYEGKAKKIFKTDQADAYLVVYKDDATAFNGEKKGQIQAKGVMNNKITSLLFEALTKKGVENHFLERLNEREQLVKKVTIIPLEVISRNRAAGSFSKRYGIEEGCIFAQPTVEFSYKNDTLNDPLLNNTHILALGLATEDEIAFMTEQTLRINEILQSIFAQCDLILVDFKLEFGRTEDGKVILADEISPDTCRLWDSKSAEKMDKDRFREDLGQVEEAYLTVLERLKAILE